MQANVAVRLTPDLLSCPLSSDDRQVRTRRVTRSDPRHSSVRTRSAGRLRASSRVLTQIDGSHRSDADEQRNSGTTRHGFGPIGAANALCRSPHNARIGTSPNLLANVTNRSIWYSRQFGEPPGLHMVILESFLHRRPIP